MPSGSRAAPSSRRLLPDTGISSSSAWKSPPPTIYASEDYAPDAPPAEDLPDDDPFSFLNPFRAFVEDEEDDDDVVDDQYFPIGDADLTDL
ncbi:hypothetical protein QFC20_004813, partial [Naganishia adeliensis]